MHASLRIDEEESLFFNAIGAFFLLRMIIWACSCGLWPNGMEFF
jgi:hypothetical protein